MPSYGTMEPLSAQQAEHREYIRKLEERNRMKRLAEKKTLEQRRNEHLEAHWRQRIAMFVSE